MISIINGLFWFLYSITLRPIVTSFWPWLEYDMEFLKRFIVAMLAVKKYHRRQYRFIDLFEISARKNPEKAFLLFEDQRWTYSLMRGQVDRAARSAEKMGLKVGDTAAMMMYNSPAFIWTFLGLTKIGVRVAMINFNLRSKSLKHCVEIAEAKSLIIGPEKELQDAIGEISADLSNKDMTIYAQGYNVLHDFKSWEELFFRASAEEYKLNLKLSIHDPLCFIYTSGTTAAVMSNRKSMSGARMMSAVGVDKNDVIYTPLPLYHSAAGIIGLGNAIEKGATLALRDKFSASQFWTDCKKFDATVIQYIGELCRYLVARPPSPHDQDHRVRVAFGNGLRRDIWDTFKTRFNIDIIGEFYAATEGNTGFLNIQNRSGAVGRASPLLGLLLPTDFVEYDYATGEPVRDSDGFCKRAKTGSPGLMVSMIKKDFEFDGYKGAELLTKKKILTNVFKRGDAYFNSGDLFIRDKEGFLYFNDRLGDTFRWKGENVSTIEVSNVLGEIDWIEDANVYGVQVEGQDGRAGMAAINIPSHDVNEKRMRELFEICADKLPVYAQPRFIRIMKQQIVTETFKLKKTDLVKENFNPTLTSDPLYYLNASAKTFSPLDQARYKEILSGTIRL